jgi:large subunit ribosomal protein L9
MKVLLKEDVDNLGYAGEVYTVADGYGRNYLIPKGLAVVASPSVMKQATVWRKKAEARREELRAEYEALSAKIAGATLKYTARAGDTGKLYGSITTAQITDDLNEKLGTEIDRRKVGNEPLRQLGEHKVVVRLSGDFQPHVLVVIEPEDGSPYVAAAVEVEEVDVVEEEVEEVEEFEDDYSEEEEEDDFEDFLDELE